MTIQVSEQYKYKHNFTQVLKAITSQDFWQYLVEQRPETDELVSFQTDNKEIKLVINTASPTAKISTPVGEIDNAGMFFTRHIVIKGGDTSQPVMETTLSVQHIPATITEKLVFSAAGEEQTNLVYTAEIATKVAPIRDRLEQVLAQQLTIQTEQEIEKLDNWINTHG